MRKVLYYTVVGVLLIIALPQAASAFEINYGFLDDIGPDAIRLEYATTESDEDLYALCERDGDCTDLTDEAPNVFPEVFDSFPITASADGSLIMANLLEKDDRTYRAVFNETSSENANLLGLVPYMGSADRALFSYANDALVFAAPRKVVRVSIENGQISETAQAVTVDESSFSYFSLSEHGKYAAWYDFFNGAQVILNIDTGETVQIPASVPSYAVFNGSETKVSFLEEIDDYLVLVTADLTEANPTGERIADWEGRVAEYEYIGDTLYAIANTKDDPLLWNMIATNVETGDQWIIAENIAYDDAYLNLRKTHDSLLFARLEGETRVIDMFTPATGETVTLTAVQPNPTRRDISREVLEFGERRGALLSPEGADESEELPLVIWLHGGPMRQTSIAFHSYFGYGVYDEILDRLASEARVLKLDYTGSWGYSESVLEDLKGTIGVEDVEDVTEAIERIEGNYETDEVYLFGASYGGYLGAKTLVNHPGLVDGVALISPVMNWYELAVTIPSTPFTEYFGGTPNSANLDLYLDASVYDDLEGIDDQPILIFYGEEDTLVPNRQTTDFKEFVESKTDIDLEVVRYEDEGHTITSSDNLIDACERIADTFEIDESVCEE